MKMHVDVATIHLEVTDALTLKDKCQVIRSLLARFIREANKALANRSIIHVFMNNAGWRV